MSTSDKDVRKSNYLDLSTKGLGYLNEVRVVTPEEGLPYLACRIKALRGHRDSVGRTEFECRVTGRSAHGPVRRLIPAVERGGKVLIGFVLTDLEGELFTHSKGSQAGEVGARFKARLNCILWAHVDGKRVRSMEVAA